MQASTSHQGISRFRHAVLILFLPALILAGTKGAIAEEAAHLRIAAASTSRRTCAAETLRFCLLALGRSTPTLAEIEEKLPLGYSGVSASNMAELCASFDISVRGTRTTLIDLSRLTSPSILHVDDCHFIVFVRLEGDRLLLFDNMIGLFDCSKEWFREHYQWSGTALVIGKQTSPLWFVFRSPWSVSLSLGIFVATLGLHMLDFPTNGERSEKSVNSS